MLHKIGTGHHHQRIFRWLCYPSPPGAGPAELAGAELLLAPPAGTEPLAGTELLAGAELLLTGAELWAALASAVPAAATLAAAAAASSYLI